MSIGTRIEPGNECARARELYDRVKDLTWMAAKKSYYMKQDGDQCYACALGRVAYAAGMPMRLTEKNRGPICEAIASPRVDGFPEISHNEMLEIEAGYEAWGLAGGHTPTPGSPFYELGAKIAGDVKHRQDSYEVKVRELVMGRKKS